MRKIGIDSRPRGQAGGLAAAASLSPEQRRARARKAARASVEARRRILREQLADPILLNWFDSCPPLDRRQSAAVCALLRSGGEGPR